MKCSKCKFYYVTWEPQIPHGCKAYQFKSKQLPCLSVENLSEKKCQLFQEKKFKNRKKEELDLNNDDLW